MQCSGQREGSGKGLLYWSSNNTYEIDFSRVMVQQWNLKRPDTEVRFQPVPEGQSSEEVILAAVVGETTPDIYSNMWQGDVESYAQAGVLVPLDTIPGFMDFLNERCTPEVIEEVTSNDGHIYQIPWKINPIMLIYNINQFNSMGYEQPPNTYDTFLEAARRFQKDVNGDGYVDRWIGYAEVVVTWWQRFFDFYPLYLAASGGKMLVENDKVIFNNHYAVDVFRFLRKLYENNYFSKERLSARQDVFLSGIIATRFTGPWEVRHAERFKPDGFRYSFSTLPVPSDTIKNVYTYGDPKNIVIFNTCEQPLKAWRFVKYMISKENDLTFLEMTSQLPRRKNLTSDTLFASYFRENPKMEPFARQARYVKGTDNSPVLKEIFDIISREYEACVVYGKKEPKNAIKDAAEAARLIMK